MITVNLTQDEIIALLYSTEFRSLYTDNREEEYVVSAKDKLRAVGSGQQEKEATK